MIGTTYLKKELQRIDKIIRYKALDSKWDMFG